MTGRSAGAALAKMKADPAAKAKAGPGAKAKAGPGAKAKAGGASEDWVGAVESLPVKLLADRLLVLLDPESAERRSSGGILIPATAVVGRRLAWGHVVAVGENVHQVAEGDRVLFDPDDRAEVEIAAQTYLLLRERNVHGVAASSEQARAAGLYL
jgi:chaperonin GroES